MKPLKTRFKLNGYSAGGRKHFPKLIEVIERHGNKEKEWVEAQAKQIRDFLSGRIVFDPKLLRFVRVEEEKCREKVVKNSAHTLKEI